MREGEYREVTEEELSDLMQRLEKTKEISSEYRKGETRWNSRSKG